MSDDLLPVRSIGDAAREYAGLAGLLCHLPYDGWTFDQRHRWLEVFMKVLDYYCPIVSQAEPTHPRTAGPVLGIRRRATLTAEQIRRAADLGGLDTFAVLRGEAARAYADLLEAGERPVAGGSD